MPYRYALLSLLLIFTSTAVSANYERLTKKWQVNCSLKNKRFSIISKSKTRAPKDFEHQLYVSFSKKPINIGTALNARSKTKSKLRSICKGLPVFYVGNENILILLRQDDRPTYDLLTLVLYNLKSKKAVSRHENVGRVKAKTNQGITIRKWEEGMDIKLIKQWFKNAGPNAQEKPVEAWLRVTIGERRLSREWLEENQSQ